MITASRGFIGETIPDIGTSTTEGFVAASYFIPGKITT